MPSLLPSQSVAETLKPLLRRALGTDAAARRTSAPAECDALIASYNVHKCVGLDGVFDPDRTIAVIAEIGADIIALQEVDKRFGDREGLLDLEALHRESGLVPISLTPTRKGHGWHGNLVLAKEGLVTAAGQHDLPGVEPRGALVVDLALTSGPLRIVAAHLGLLRRSRAQQVTTILGIVDEAPHVPTLVMGDLNEWRIGPRSALRELQTAFGCAVPPLPSFPANIPVLALDRIIANRPGLVDHCAVHDTPLARTASDHLPLKAWVNLSCDATGAATRTAAA